MSVEDNLCLACRKPLTAIRFSIVGGWLCTHCEGKRRKLKHGRRVSRSSYATIMRIMTDYADVLRRLAKK